MLQIFWCLLFLCFRQHLTSADVETDKKVCFGTASGLSVGEDRMDHYTKMWKRYNNCTIVKGNLEITGLQATDLDVTFLQNIEVVTGYVIIAFNYVSYLPLEKLKIIRGRELYRDKYALYVKVNFNGQDPTEGLQELRLKSLTEIVRGNVHISKNMHLCFANTIHWNDIFNPMSRRMSNWTAEYNQNQDPGICGPCDPSCEAGCWGRGPSMCQKLTLEVCSPDCGDARCRGPTRNDCCDAECAAGCTGPSDKDCQICLHVNNSGSCENACPAAHIYDPQTQRNIPNPHFKYHYYDHCVDKCPRNLLVEDNGCVKSCQVGSHNNGSGRCVPCKGNICDKECYGVSQQDGPLAKNAYIDSTNIHHFEGCNIVKGNIVFLSITFLGDVHQNVSAVSEAQLNAFRDVKIITGYLQIVAWPKNLTDFSVFQNLQQIDGVDLYRDLAAVVIQDNTHHEGLHHLPQITSLGLRSLKTIKNGNVYIGYLRNLCYASLVNWTSIIQHSVTRSGFVNGALLRNNKPSYSECNDTKCHSECSSDGCWGPGPNECLQCVHFSYNGSCMPSCPMEMRVHPHPGEQECRSCHSECRFCTAEGPGNCTECLHYSLNGTCVEECPSNMYPVPISGECKPCNSNCVAHKSDRMCNGPNNTIGAEGCNYCDYVITTRTLKIIQCLPVGSLCPNAHFSHEGPTLNAAKHTCVPCVEGCLNCTGIRREDCAHALSLPEETVVVAVLIPLILVLGAIIGLIFYCRYRRKQIIKKQRNSMRALGIDPNSPDEAHLDPRTRLMEPMTPSGVAPNQAQLRIVKDAELRIGKILGSGAFGTVHKGYWIPDLAPRERVKVPVAIKVLRDESSQVASNEILDEAFVMASCEHPNLVRLLGISLSQRIMLITQLMPLGNLLEYVRENKDSIASQHLLNWCLQITKGMRYLSEEKHLVHRDLAARNVLVKSPNHVRITDFGLAKLLDVNEDVYRAEGGKMPIKWLALESIQHRIFTQKSDVWSFGVTMWELMTFGKKPYENVPAREVHTLLERGERLPQPYVCTIDIYMLFIKCWTVDADARPTFRELSEELSKMARDPKRYVVIDNEGALTELPSPTTSEFLRSLMKEDGDDFPITDAEEYLHPHMFNTHDEALIENPISLQPCPTSVPWKRQQQPLASTSSQHGLLDWKENGNFGGRTDSGKLGQSRHHDRRLDSVMTTMTSLSGGSQPNGVSTPFASVTMPTSPDIFDEQMMETSLSTIPFQATGGSSRNALLDVINNTRTLSESSDVFGPTFSKEFGDQSIWDDDRCSTNPLSRLNRAREDSTTMRYSADPVSMQRQQTKPNGQRRKVNKQIAAKIEFAKDEDGYLTPFEAANRKPEYLDPGEFPQAAYAHKPSANITDVLPTSSALSNPEYEHAFLPADNDIMPNENNYEAPLLLENSSEYQNVESDGNLKLDAGSSSRQSSPGGESIISEKRDSGMQSDEDVDQKTTAVVNPNYDVLQNAKSNVEQFLGQKQTDNPNAATDCEKVGFPDDDIFKILEKNHKLSVNKDRAQRTYSEPDSGVGIDVAADNIYHQKLSNAWDSNE